MDDEGCRQAFEDLFAAMMSNEIENVITDLRENIGGNFRVVEALLRHLPVDSYATRGSKIRYSKQAAERVGMRRTWGLRHFRHHQGE